jgi:hypothetical protein
MHAHFPVSFICVLFSFSPLVYLSLAHEDPINEEHTAPRAAPLLSFSLSHTHTLSLYMLVVLEITDPSRIYCLPSNSLGAHPLVPRYSAMIQFIHFPRQAKDSPVEAREFIQ